VVTRWTGAVTHDGELSGIPPTGNRGMPPGMEIVRISGGKVVEGWEGYDTMNSIGRRVKAQSGGAAYQAVNHRGEHLALQAAQGRALAHV
jgi:hypothetical protein